MIRLISVLTGAFLLATSTINFAQKSASNEILRMPDGSPDLRGIWQTVNTAVWNIQDHTGELGIPAGQGVVAGNTLPYLPSALEQRQKNYENRLTEDSEANCLMVGVPRITYMPYPFQIAQNDNQLIMLYEYVHTVRNIYFNKEHPAVEIQWWMGDSRAVWDGDTLVVDVTKFNDKTWFDRSGNYHSEQLHVVERYTPTGPNHIHYEVTIEDPKVYSELWTMSMPIYRRQESDMQLLEYECYAYMEEAKDAE
jgi:hypothetical protein